MSRQKSSTQRVIVVEAGSLFEEGVTKLLAGETNLQVSSITYADDARLLQDISQARPDVIVMHEASPLDSVHIIKLLEEILPYLSIPQVIIIRSDSNTMDVYEKRSVTVSESGDLFALIRNRKEGA